MKTEVCITVDMEFSIGGAFYSSGQLAPLGEEVVGCSVDGREHGLGFLLDVLRRSGHRATFFTEVLQTTYFGDAPMGRAVERVASAGHDVQLHIHPCWLHFRDDRWKRPGFQPNDSCVGRSGAELDEMIQIGASTFARWGVPAPIALRTGGFRGDRNVYRAMARAGLPLASNVSLGIFQPTAPELAVASGARVVEGVVEVPAMSFRSLKYGLFGQDNWRTLAITATSAGEMESLLWWARREGVRKVVVLTHPFEFIRRLDSRYRRLAPDWLNQRRLVHLTDFLNQHANDFCSVTFGERQVDWVQAGDERTSTMSVGRVQSLGRVVQNALNDSWPRF